MRWQVQVELRFANPAKPVRKFNDWSAFMDEHDLKVEDDCVKNVNKDDYRLTAGVWTNKCLFCCFISVIPKAVKLIIPERFSHFVMKGKKPNLKIRNMINSQIF
ncbi:MAG: hypothetical protein GY874_04300 [Desulfobacteraceae bacterium]|nr:hypothetical protein [Desulfobacteraceae bacterium]